MRASWAWVYQHMSYKEYKFSPEIRKASYRQAKRIKVKADAIHHIVPRELAKEYNLPVDRITSQDNAIALEDSFHEWIHENFDKEDYIFLAVALLGIPESVFDE